MGSQPSKTAAADPAGEKALLERLHRAHVNDGESSSTESASSNEKSDVKLLREPEGLPVHLTKSWQSRFLSDPKNK